MKEIPRLQTSEWIPYCSPEILSGCGEKQRTTTEPCRQAGILLQSCSRARDGGNHRILEYSEFTGSWNILSWERSNSSSWPCPGIPKSHPGSIPHIPEAPPFPGEPGLCPNTFWGKKFYPKIQQKLPWPSPCPSLGSVTDPRAEIGAAPWEWRHQKPPRCFKAALAGSKSRKIQEFFRKICVHAPCKAGLGFAFGLFNPRAHEHEQSTRSSWENPIFHFPPQIQAPQQWKKFPVWSPEVGEQPQLKSQVTEAKRITTRWQFYFIHFLILGFLTCREKKKKAAPAPNY